MKCDDICYYTAEGRQERADPSLEKWTARTTCDYYSPELKRVSNATLWTENGQWIFSKMRTTKPKRESKQRAAEERITATPLVDEISNVYLTLNVFYCLCRTTECTYRKCIFLYMYIK